MEPREETQARLARKPVMSAIAQANSGTGPVREGYEIDRNRLSEWMESHVPGFRGPLTVAQFKGGQSNPTYRLTTPGRSYVLRRKPPGQLLKGAHAVEREARVMAALGTTGFPVPQIYGVCTDDSVIGTWFFVMEMVEGRIFWDATYPGVSRAERPEYFDAMNRALADLHKVDLEQTGLSDFGRPSDYFRRQITRWSGQYRADPEAGADAAMDELIDWLAANVPAADEVSLVHGDLRCDNMIYHPTEPHILAVLDWELSTLGNPLADFAYNALMYRMPPDIVAGLQGHDIDALNIPSEEEYVAAYCERMGRTSIPNWDFYVAFQFFRLAAIFHGIRGRVLRGTATNAQARERGGAFPRLARLGLDGIGR